MRSLRRLTLQTVIIATISAALTSCGAGSAATTAAPNPALALFHKLDWAGDHASSPVWSPDGRYIALFIGNSQDSAHLFVASADGSKLVDEASWDCNQADQAAIAWLPNGGLSCVSPSADRASLDLSIAASPSAPVKSFVVPGGTAGGQYGAVWLPDGSALLASETVDLPPDSYLKGRRSSLHVITRDGKETQTIVISDGLEWPHWLSRRTKPTLSFQSFSTNPPHLATSTVIRTANGTVHLGTPVDVPGGDYRAGGLGGRDRAEQPWLWVARARLTAPAVRPAESTLPAWLRRPGQFRTR
jgi:hypothetical protein